jgi:cobalt-zinc-cadmium efflux system membrane fusion protein
MMNIKSIVTLLVLSQLALYAAFTTPSAHASSAAAAEETVEKGPNNGRMLKEGDFAIELAIFENGVPPEFRVFATKGGNKIAANAVSINVKLTRLGDVVDDINFRAENDYLRGDMEIYEPHSFAVSLTASYQGKNYQWSYDNFEGRTTISDDMAQTMNIETEFVGSQTFHETLKVFGKLTPAPNATRHISARYPGEVKSLLVTLGQRVKKGQLLLSIKSNESLQTYKLYAPISGLITSQNTAMGQQTTDTTLLTITDTAQLMLEVSVFPMDRAKVKLGAPVTIFLPGNEQIITTKLLDAQFDLNELQAKVFRAAVDNTEGLLSAGQFVSAQILLSSYQVDMAVKAIGLQAFRDFTVVYTKVGQQYEVRMLELGRKAGPWVEVLGGITSGSEYVTENSYIIKADIDKSGASHDH